EMWHHYVFDRAINTAGLSPAGSQNCRLLHLGGTPDGSHRARETAVPDAPDEFATSVSVGFGPGTATSNPELAPLSGHTGGKNPTIDRDLASAVYEEDMRSFPGR